METKFNFSDEESNVNLENKSISKNAKGLFFSLFSFLKEILDFRKDTDKEATLLSIKNDISIKGPTAWILICSIFVASIGLNTNSIPVVIGAMLISPLMGPILGFGMSIAINDLETLKKSLINFTVMVFLSVLTAYLFFAFFPLREESSELLSRTKPDIRDVLIAFFGGLALIIARTKKGSISSVVFGVAIATALMPPLCTVGFGLATGKISFALGAMYLFMINTLYIVLATYIVVKLLGFPMINYANSKRRTKIARLVTLFSILMLIPAFFTFSGVLNESKFNNSANEFLRIELDGLKNKDYLEKTAIIDYNYDNMSSNFVWPWLDKKSKIVLNTFGLDPISKETISLLKAKLNKYPSLSLTDIVFNQQEIQNDFKEQKRFLSELRSRDSLDLIYKSNQIEILTNKLNRLEKIEKYNLFYQTILNEVKFNHELIQNINYSFLISSNDTITIFTTKWNDTISFDRINIEENKLNKWLKFKLNNQLFELKREE
ncbi:MAG: TIGR00341 family protein [Bacteroidetes bacterium]|jgi:uncharacterized hydrophobic protein (TIGR00271 family)|nr:TIGR00341 family protein [Bacteroidota bacterium]MDA1018645.1 TIGR00341 family protein [Bacteroidota bacterium]|tara:strand:+ start:4378 stop:5853 length:1476 start_codon:yes stop_codon:yes gene_type:complete